MFVLIKSLPPIWEISNKVDPALLEHHSRRAGACRGLSLHENNVGKSFRNVVLIKEGMCVISGSFGRTYEGST